ncbi:ATP-binding protein [Parendozoicomonas haliclonae]|nr:ATP-binding protein [Parendozoicomonas haliclonae]
MKITDVNKPVPASYWELPKGRYWAIHTITALLLVVMCWSMLSGILTSRPENIAATNGTLVLPSDTLPVALRGEWHFAWHQLLSWEEFPESSPTTIPVPSRWNRLGDDSYPGPGYGTYSLQLTLPNERNDLGLKIKSIYRAASVWVNGEPIKQLGKVGTSEESETPRDETILVPLPAAKTFNILIQVSSFHHIDGGMAKAPIIDTWENLMYEERIRVAGTTVLSISFLTLGIFVLFLTISSRMDTVSLLLGSTFLFGGLRVLGVEKLFFYIDPEFSVEWLFKAEYIGMFLSASSYLMFLQRLFPNDIKSLPITGQFYLGVIGSVLTLLTPPLFYVHFRDPWIWLNMSTICYLIFCMIRIVILRRDHAIQVAALTVMFALAAVNETLFYARLTETRLSNWGYVFVAVSSVFFLGARIRTLITAAMLRRAELQQAVDTSTHELKLRLDQLEEARSEAQSASYRKSELMAIMSHEVRTPLGGLIGALKLLQGNNLSLKQEKLRASAEAASQSLLDIVNDALDFSSLDAKEKALKSEPFELGRWLGAIESLMTISARDKGLPLIVQPPQFEQVRGEMWLQGDQQRLRQALINLIHNAIKFTEQGSITVSCRYQRGQLHLAVTDTGPGIPEEKKVSIFQSFVQGKQSNNANDTSRTRGVGLGLAITHEIVSRMGGRVSLNSQLHHGSCFTLDVPLEKVTPDTAKSNQTSSADYRRITRSDYKVLVVDDDPTNTLYLSEIIERAGFTCIAAHSGQEALDQTEAQSINILILDYHLPDTNGAALHQQILQYYADQACHHNLYAILLSGNIDNGFLPDKELNQFDNTLQKPARPSTLCQLLDSAERQFLLARGISINLSALQETTELLGQSGMQRVVQAATGSVAESFRMMYSALEEQDQKTLAASAHRLRSAALTIHASQTSQQAKFIEEANDSFIRDLQMLEMFWEKELAEVRQLITRQQEQTTSA